MTYIQKALVTTVAAMSFATFAQSSGGSGSTSGTTSGTDSSGAMGSGSTTSGSTTSSPSSTHSSGTSASTSGTVAMARDPAMVRQVQQALIDKGISTGGSVDGFWGTRSTSAMREFQRQQNLPITGQIDSTTVSALGLSSSGFSPGSNSSDTSPGMQQRQGRSPSDVNDDTAPMDNTTPGTGRSPSDTQQR